MSTKRLTKEARVQELLEVALKLAVRKGFNKVDRVGVADAAKCSVALVSHHLGNANDLPDLVMAFAIEKRNLRVIAQGLSFRHPLALAAPEDLRKRAADSVA